MSHAFLSLRAQAVFDLNFYQEPDYDGYRALFGDIAGRGPFQDGATNSDAWTFDSDGNLRDQRQAGAAPSDSLLHLSPAPVS